jgi:hypothetical protein
MGTVSVFLQNYGKKEWDTLNDIICAWREAEEKNRAACGLPSVTTRYSGCPDYRRRGRRLRNYNNETVSTTDEYDWTEIPPVPQRPLSAHDVIVENFLHTVNGNTTHVPKRLLVEKHNVPADNEALFDQDATHFEQSQFMNSGNTSRRLAASRWYNYFPLPACKTEYYHRYSGTQTVRNSFLVCIELPFCFDY